MKTFARFGLAAALVLFLGLSAGADDKKVIEKKDPKEPTTDQEFLTHALSCNIAEVKMGEYVAKNAANPDVRKFAQHMVDDHSKARDKLLNMARDWKLGVFEGLDKEKQDKFDALKKLKGSDFDREYMRMMVEGHEKALREFEKWSTNAKDEKLRTFCRENIPTLRDHLEQARKLHKSL